MKLAQLVSIILVCIGTYSCIQYRDVTNDPAFHTDYKVDGVYRLKQDAVMLKANDESPEQPYWLLDAPGRSFAVHLDNVEAIRSNPEQWKGFEIVQAGTLVRFRYLGLTKSVDTFGVAPYGTFVSGPHSGARVDFREVSRVEGDNSIFVDPSWLELTSK